MAPPNGGTTILDELKAALSLMPVPALLADAQGNIRLANEELIALFAYDSETLIGMSVDALVPEAQRSRHGAHRENYRNARTRRPMGQGRELAGVTADGRKLTLELGLNPIDVAGEPWVLVTAADVSARRSAEAQMHLALDAAASAMLVIDPSGEILYVNRATEELFGFPRAELSGRRIETLVPEEMRDQHRGDRARYAEHGVQRKMGDGRTLFALCRDGSRIRVEVALTPVEAQSGLLTVATVTDLTERLRAEQLQQDHARAERRILEERAERLKDLNDELLRYAYSASHDLKAPMSSVLGLLELCRRDLLSGEQDAALDCLARAVEVATDATGRIERLLDVAQTEPGEIRAETIDLRAMVTGIWQEAASETEAPPRLETAFAHHDQFTFNRDALSVILTNLITNAVSFRAEDGRDAYIRISTRQVRNDIALTIADNGCGMPERIHGEVFRMYSRFHRTSGDGLGLAIVKRYCDMLGAGIEFDSVEGEGTTFTLILPQPKA